MVLTLISLGLLITVSLGGTNKSNDTLNKLYFFRANTSDFNATNEDFTDKALELLTQNNATSVNTTTVYDFYHVSLWNYCAGNFTNSTASKDNTNDDVTFCSKHTNEFWFNPVEVWGLNQSVADQLFGKALNDGLKAYRAVAKWMFISYLVAIIATIVEVLVGFLALFSRWGSLATTIVSSVSSFFLLAFALTATILYATLTGTFNTALKKYNIHASVGHNIFVILWLAVAFSLASGLFWLFSSCCCSGRSDKIKGYGDNASRKGVKAERTPYTYERVESPFLGQTGNAGPAPAYHQNVPMDNMGHKATSYEPFRHGQP